MKTRIVNLLLILTCLAGQDLFAQPFTNRGKEFWVGYGHHQYMEKACDGSGTLPDNNRQEMTLYISAEEAATVTITIDSSGVGGVMSTWWSRTYHIPANTVINIEDPLTPASSYTASALPFGPIPKGGSGYDARLWNNPPPANNGGEGHFRKRGIHIESDVPVVVYSHIYGDVSSGASMLMPTHTWGYSYTSVNSAQSNASRSYSWMYVVAKEDFTKIRVTPSVQSRLGKPAGVPFEVVMMKGQIYQLIGQADCATGDGEQLTGTTVKSIPGPDGKCHAIAVFGGSSRTLGESNSTTPACGGGGRDNDMQQLFPEQAWGMEYLTTPFSRASGTTIQANQFQESVYKVIVKDPATVVKKNGVTLTGLVVNKYYIYRSGTADRITADKPIMVAQFMAGQSTNCNAGSGDPEMIVISPVEQAAKKIGFYRNDEENIQVNYLTLVVPTAGVPSLRIDYSTSINHSYPHPNKPGYTVVVKGWPASKAQCLVTCDSGFNAITYGLGGAESYGYNAGTNIINLNGISSIHNVFDSTRTTSDYTCRKTPIKLSALIVYQPTKLEWKLSALGTNITPAIDVIQTNPVHEGTVLINGNVYYKYSLPGTYVFNQGGTQYIPVIATQPIIDGCDRVEELTLKIEVRESPVTNFTYIQSSDCGNQVCFTGPTTAATGFTVKNWRWQFPDLATDSTKIPCKTFSAAGIYNVYHQIITTEGCLGDTTRPVTVNSAAANPLVTSGGGQICEGSSVNLNVTGGTTYTWSPATGLSSTTGSTVTASPTVNTTYTVTSVVSGCTYTQTIAVTVTPKPPAPVVTTPVVYCQGDMGAVPLVATPLAGNTITWYNNPALTGGYTTTPTPSTGTAGLRTYWVTQKTADNCVSLPATITVNINAQIGNNTIGPSQERCSGTPDALTAASSPTGGSGTYAYQWESSTDGGTSWNVISGATLSTYTPPATVGTVQYRRKITSGPCNSISNTATVTIQGSLTGLGISGNQPLCSGEIPSLFVGETPSGGSGTFTYAWERSSDNVTWTVISGETGINYQSPALTTSTYFRRKVVSSTCTAYSPSILVTVNPKPMGSITGPASVCADQPYSVNFTATAGLSPFTVQLNITGTGGYTNTITQTVTGNGPVPVTILPAYSNAGAYSITFTSLTDANNCVQNTGLGSVNFTVTAIPALTVSPDVAICQGSNTILTANGADTYVWSPAAGLSSTTGSSVTAAPVMNTSYIVTGTTAGCSASGSVTVTINAVPGKPSVITPVTYCQDDFAAPLSATYTAGNTLTWYNNAALTGGTTSAYTPLTGTAGTTLYYVTQTTPEGCRSATESISVVVQAKISGNTIGPDQTICEGSPADPITSPTSPNGGDGTFAYSWERSVSGGPWTVIAGATNASYTPPSTAGSIAYRRIAASGKCTNTSNAVTISVLGSVTNTGISADHSICEGGTTNQLTGQLPSGGNGTFAYQWQSSANATTWTDIAGATSQHYPPVSLTANTYFRRRVSSGGCTVSSSPVLVTVTPKPAATIAGSTVCEYDAASVTFTPTAGSAPYSVVLNITGPGGYTNTITQSMAGAGAIPVLPVNSAPGAYNVVLASITDNNNCVRTGTTGTTINVTARPALTVSPDVAICRGASTVLSATGGTTYVWSPSAGLSSTTGASVTASPTTNTSYIVTATQNGCNASGSVTVTVNPIPVKPTVTSPVTYCQGADADLLSATASTGNTLTWYDNAALTNGQAMPFDPSTATAGSKNYYVTQTSTAGCTSQPEIITVNIQPQISGNTVSADQLLCTGTPSNPIGSTAPPTGGGGTYVYQWQQSTDGGTTWTNINSNGNGLSYSPGTPSTTTQYRRLVNSGFCTSTSNVVTISVQGAVTDAGITGTQSICTGDTPTKIEGQPSTGVTYQWEQSSNNTTWTAIAGETGEDYQPGALTSTMYYRRKVSNSACSSTSNVVQVTVNPLPEGSISGSVVCEGIAASVSFTPSAGTAPYTVVLNVTGPNGYASTVTRTLNAAGPVPVLPANSAPGTYNIVFTSLTDNNNCAKNTGLTGATITVNPKPVMQVSPNVSVCQGQGTVLTASGAVSYSWSPATGLSAATGASVTATPSATTTYTVTGTSNGCSSTGTVTVTVNSVPSKPSVISPVTYCQDDESSLLSATATTGNVLTWYNNAGLTNGQSTPYRPSTAAGGTTNYYVTQTNSFGCASAPEVIAVIVQPKIANNTISADHLVCIGSSANSIGSATAPTGGSGTYTYQWQQSTDNGVTWTNVPATSLTYNPGAITVSTQYRRLVSSGLCNSVSNIVTVGVQGIVTNVNISGSQEICSGSQPLRLDGQDAGSVLYQWEISNDNQYWSNIDLANQQNYQPGTLTATTYYRRKVSNGACTSTSNTVTVTVNPLPNATLTGTTVCEYDAASISFTPTGGAAPYTVVLNVTGPGGYTQTITRSISSSESIPVLPANSAAGTYTVAFTSITDSKNCVRNTGLTGTSITVTATPVLNIPSAVPGCQGASTTLTASGAQTYTWSPATGLNTTTGPTVIATPAVTTVYTITGTTNGCSSTADVEVTINQRPTATFTVDNNVCQESQATFVPSTSSSNVTSWKWNFGDGTGEQVYNNGFSFTRPYTTANTFNVKLVTVDANGCESDTARQSITVRPLPTADFTLPVSICLPNGVASFQNRSAISDNSTLGYVWDLGDQSPTVTTTNVSHVYAANGPYSVTLTATSAYGCKDVESKLLSSGAFFDKPIAKFSVSPEALCQGADNSFTDESTAPNSTVTAWRWNFGDGTPTVTARNPVRRYKNPGAYEVSLVVTNAVGCVSDTAKSEVNVYLQPVVDAGPSFVVTLGTVVTFKPKVNDTTLSFTWTPSADFANPSKLNQTLTAFKDQRYTLTAVGDEGCSASDTLVVKILNPIKIPNAFSPNGDGTNDTWEIPYLKDYPGATVHIYNRYGQVVHTTYGYGRPWDGTYNGKPLPVATYYYVITLHNGFAPISGSVTIVK